MARKSRWNITPEEAQAMCPTITATWVYGRISSENEKSEDSIDNQIAIVKGYIDGQPGLVFRGAFADSGFSGTNFDRPDYEKMMAGVYSGEVRCVAVKDLSRMGRTYIEVGELLFDTFVKYGVRFISVNDQYDSFADDAGRKKLLILFKNLVNHMYSKDLGKKIKSAFLLKQQKGEVMGALPPYGYLFTTEGGGKGLTLEPKSADVVRLIFDMRLRGDSTIKITDHLNRNGIAPPGNHYYNLGVITHEKHAKKTVWQNNYICNLLRNEVYTGALIQGKFERNGKTVREKPREEWVIHENAHQSIVERPVFDEVQCLLAEAREKYKKRGNALDENIFAGKVVCSRCGRAAKRGYYRKNKTEVKYNYFCRYCDDELRPSYGPDTIRRVPLEKVEAAVISEISMRMKVCIDIDRLLDEIAGSPVIDRKRQALLAERGHLEKAEGKAADMLAAAYTHHLAGLLDAGEFALAREKFERDKLNAAADLVRVDMALNEYEAEEIRKNDCLSRFRGFKGFTKLDKALVSALVDRIEITPMTDKVIFVPAFQDDYIKLTTLADESEVLANAR